MPPKKLAKTPAAPITPEQIISGMFKIKPADVKRIVASKPGKAKRKK
jgi:hypothetical protein